MGGDKLRFQLPRFELLNGRHWGHIQKYHHLSDREVQVAKLVCKGLHNNEIAKVLKIKDGTVKTHMRNIYRRVNTNNKIAMLLKFIDTANKFSGKSRTTPLAVVEIEGKSRRTILPKRVRNTD